jgi:CheY-like chemotaxis protein/Tfp pilus assembly protein PilZ
MSDSLTLARNKTEKGGTVPAKAIGVRILLVSGDIRAIDTLCHFMEHMAMHVEVCSDMGSATRRLCHNKFEAVVVDFEDQAEALGLIKTSRGMTSHKAAVVLAILNSSNEMPDAFRAGANFALVRPLLPAILLRTLRAAYPLMVRERRRYYRYPMQIPIHLSGSSRSEFVATSVDISEGGMALATSVPLQVGERVSLKLTLPGTEGTTKISSEVCWVDNAGRVGLEFVKVPATVVERLQSWIAGRLEGCQPC